MMLILLFIAYTICEVTYYISPSGSSSNDGLSKDNPLNWNWNNILKKTNNVYTNSNKETNSFTIIFLEGDYYVDQYGLTMSGADPNIYYRLWADEGARVRIIGGKKLPSFSHHPSNSKIWITEIDTTQIQNTSYNLIFNNRRISLSRAPKSWNYDRLRGYYATDDPGNSEYVIRHYIVSSELITILSHLPIEQLNKARIICKHHYHTETDEILSIDTTKNEIIK